MFLNHRPLADALLCGEAGCRPCPDTTIMRGRSDCRSTDFTVLVTCRGFNVRSTCRDMLSHANIIMWTDRTVPAALFFNALGVHHTEA